MKGYIGMNKIEKIVYKTTKKQLKEKFNMDGAVGYQIEAEDAILYRFKLWKKNAADESEYAYKGVMICEDGTVIISELKEEIYTQDEI